MDVFNKVRKRKPWWTQKPINGYTPSKSCSFHSATLCNIDKTIGAIIALV